MTDVQMSVDETPMPSTSIPMSLNDNTRHDIRTILERPVNLGTFTWSGANTELATQLPTASYDADSVNYLQKWDFPQAITDASAIATAKLQNYQYLHADIEIEVKVNAQPFLQGALMAVYNPYLEETGDFRRKGTRFLASQTSCPHKILSLEEGNSLKLTCPYANIYDFFDLTNASNQFGTVYLYVFSQLQGSEAVPTCKYTVYARFVNPRFFVPTHQTFSSAASIQQNIKHLEGAGYKVRARRRAEGKMTPRAAKDSGETQGGPLSTGATGVAMISEALSGVPVIGEIASTVAWVARMAAQGLAAIGLSKTISTKEQSKMIIKPTQNLIHTEGVDDGVTLALLQDNGIDGSSFIPENKDEMSLAYIFSRPNYYHRKAASATDFSGRKLITAWEVSPFSSYQYGLTGEENTLFLGSFAYTSMFGTLWRGTINFDIKVIKTVFHQGRFAIVYLPQTLLGDVPDTLGELLNTNYNVVCNLKDRQDELGRTEFRVSVPFISHSPWRETLNVKEGSSETFVVPDANTLDVHTGCLAIYSLVDLSFPPTVKDGVTFMIAHSGGEDYQVARPTVQLAPGYQSRYAESDIGPVFIPKDENLLVPSHGSCDVTAQTTGEYFTSLRSLMKRLGQFSTLGMSNTYQSFRTRYFTENASSGRRIMTGEVNEINVVPTPWYMISFLYRFYNGSSNLKVLPDNPVTKGSSFLSFVEDTISYEEIDSSLSLGQPVFEQLQFVSGAFEVRTPYYRAIRGDVVNYNALPKYGDVYTNVRLRNGASPEDTSIAGLYESAGDDFNFFFLVGPPPMCVIGNVTSFDSFPNNQTKLYLDFSTINGNSADSETNDYECHWGTIDAIPAPANGLYNITSPTVTAPSIVVTSGTVTRAWSDYWMEVSDDAFKIYTHYEPVTDVSLDPTMANIVSVGTVTDMVLTPRTSLKEITTPRRIEGSKADEYETEHA